MCSDSTLYTGITTDIARRVQEHNTLALGAAYTRTRRPVRLVYVRSCKNRSEAQQQEYVVKHLPRIQKILLARHWLNQQQLNTADLDKIP